MKKQILLALLSGILYYFAWTGQAWPLAWIAPLPVLWFAYGSEKWVRAGIVAFVAYAIGSLQFVQMYYGALPSRVLILGTVILSFVYSLVILGARLVVRRTNGIAGMFAFPLLMVSWDVLTARFTADGSFGSPAYSQVLFLPVLQIASLFGIAAITFTISLLPNAIAVAILYPAARKIVATVVSVWMFAVLAFGFYELKDREQSREIRVGLTATDAFAGAFRTKDAKLVDEVVADYSARIAKLKQSGAEIVVLPEEIAAQRPEWRDSLKTNLAKVARENRVTVVAGFRRWDEGELRNVAEVYTPEGELAHEYFKQHLVPGLESAIAPGDSALTLGNGLGVAICKDMDFPPLGREYSAQGTGLMLVPAWDFVKDEWLHASMAIVRGVEGGYSVARSAREGLLTVSDRHGRLIAAPVSSASAEAMLVASVPVGSGRTLYSRIGDVFGWACMAIAVGLLGWSATRGEVQRKVATSSGKS